MPLQDDATPSYRGYRHQALYTLARMLDVRHSGEHSYHPEGLEDLAIRDAEDRLVEVIQVKDLSESLTLSSFSADKRNSFFYRVAAALKDTPDLRVVIATFGSIGPELENAVARDGPQRTAVARKLSVRGYISEAEALNLLAHIEFEPVNAGDLTAQVEASLRTLLTGIDPERAFENLSYWLYRCAETKRKIRRADAIAQISAVGRFLAERAAHHREWFTSIEPLSDDARRSREGLSDEFYRGIGARYEHILAGLDVARPTKMKEIADKLREKRVVVVHGASGQGKSTLIYRFLHDHFPDEWRLLIKAVTGREHALSIARAVSGHASAVGVPVAVYVDVGPSDSGWEELVKELRSYPNVLILVTIRAEDWSRAALTGADVPLEEVELSLGEDEARGIFRALVAKHVSARFLAFEDAWEAFGSRGPLLEFVYLVTQGASLRERLSAQVRRIRDEVANGQRASGDLDLLRIVAVASAGNARLHAVPLATSLHLDDPSHSLERLEKEYLLRVTEDGTIIEGLHAVRSTILVQLLTDIFSPWTGIAARCIPHLAHDDIEAFLLHAFTRNADDVAPILDALTDYHPHMWAGVCGVLRALLWVGVREYTDRNAGLIRDAFADVGPGWYAVLDFDVADVSPGSIPLASLTDLLPAEGRERIEAIRRRQTDKGEIVRRAHQWLATRASMPPRPVSEIEWAACAETLFWVRRLAIDDAVPDWLTPPAFTDMVATLPLETLADLVLVLSQLSDASVADVLAEHRPAILARFKRETQTLVIEDTAEAARAHFWVPTALVLDPDIDASPGVPAALAATRAADDPVHREGMRRVWLLRRLLPERAAYGCQGYGHLTGDGLHDSSTKTAIPRNSLPPRWPVGINATFRGYATYPFRPATWEEYARSVMDVRRAAVRTLMRLERALGTYFATSGVRQIVGEQIDAEAWERSRHHLRAASLLPRCAVDAWGFSDEATDAAALEKTDAAGPVNRRSLALQRHMPLHKSVSEYTHSLDAFFSQAMHVLLLNPILGRGVGDSGHRMRVIDTAATQGIRIDFRRHSTVNFSIALRALPAMQRRFRHHLGRFVPHDALAHLERQETELLRVWCLWHAFAFHPDRTIPQAARTCLAEYRAVPHDIRAALRRSLAGSSSGTLTFSVLSETEPWDGAAALWIGVDGHDALEVFQSVQTAIDAVRAAVDGTEANLLRWHAIETHWPSLVIVPSVRGRLLTPRAWRFYVPDLLHGAPLQWWQYYLHPLPLEVPSSLGMSVWDDGDLRLALRLWRQTGEMGTLARYMSSLRTLTIEDEDIAWLQPRVEEVSGGISAILAAVIGAEAELFTSVDVMAAAYNWDTDSVRALKAMIVELYEATLPSPDLSTTANMTVDELAGWAEQLEAAQVAAWVVAFTWATLVLGERSRDEGRP